MGTMMSSSNRRVKCVPNLARLPDRVFISGTGLIGTSIGLGLRLAGWEVVGWDPDPAASSEALRRGAIQQVGRGPDDHSDASVIVLSGPLTEVTATLAGMRTDALVTDVAGVKAPVAKAADHLPRFVGGHPMAGGATRGPDLASSHLFRGAPWVLTTDGADDVDLERMESIVRSLGANPKRMTAAMHDSAVARVSHLPHVIAASLVDVASSVELSGLVGGGFRDLTRVAGSDTSWWPDVLGANSSAVIEAITEMQARLERLKSSLASNDEADIRATLDRAREIRAGLGEHHTQVRVILLDQPGELARVGHALESSEADVRDIQLRHGEHGGGGVLTISVSPASAEDLRRHLEAEGFNLEGS